MAKWMIGIIWLFLPDLAAAEIFQSTDQRTQLIELYTSEGCSSCPPADRWLSEFKDDERLWKEVIPVALHVDYWDHIGWKDRFAQPAFAHRQRDYVAHGHLSQVYTPGIVVDGSEWRRWFRARGKPPIEPTSTGILLLETGDGTFSALYQDGKADTLNFVWLGFDLASEVHAGENKGKRLRHDFVVLQHRQYKGDSTWSARLPPRPDVMGDLALVAWVSNGSDPAPLQAVGGWYR